MQFSLFYWGIFVTLCLIPVTILIYQSIRGGKKPGFSLLFWLLFAAFPTFKFVDALIKYCKEPTISSCKELPNGAYEVKDSTTFCSDCTDDPSIFTANNKCGCHIDRSDTCIICFQPYYKHNKKQYSREHLNYLKSLSEVWDVSRN